MNKIINVSLVLIVILAGFEAFADIRLMASTNDKIQAKAAVKVAPALLLAERAQ